jgi:hypothetical protein
MFTKEEAVSLLEKSWGLTNVVERFQNGAERRKLLDEIVTTVQMKVPFQGITFLAAPQEQRKRPNIETIKSECVAGDCFGITLFFPFNFTFSL